MKYSIVIALICATLAGKLIAHAGHLDSQKWTLFKSEHGKSYESPAEEARLFANFMVTKQLVERHNAQSNRSFTAGLNHMVAGDRGERAKGNRFRVNVNFLNETQKRENAAYLAKVLGSSNKPVPDEFDWRKIPGRVSSVKTQGSCGSCWAISAVGVLEGQEIGRIFNETSQFKQLSEQSLIDCSKSNQGCDGGTAYRAFNDLMKLGGIVPVEGYSYTGKVGKCQFRRLRVVMEVAGGVVLPARDEIKLKETLFKYGPIAVSLYARSLREYKSGIYDDHSSCDPNSAGHGVLLVGYGTDPQKGDYWIVKNSWGPKWGENGYFRIKRGVNMCNIALSPTIAKF